VILPDGGDSKQMTIQYNTATQQYTIVLWSIYGLSVS